MITKKNADEVVQTYLKRLEHEMENFGSALPENTDRPPHQLTVTSIEEYDFGWVYFYNSAEYQKTGDFLHSLAGNTPVIVARTSLKLYSCGTGHPLEYYVEEFRNGVRRPL